MEPLFSSSIFPSCWLQTAAAVCLSVVSGSRAVGTSTHHSLFFLSLSNEWWSTCANRCLKGFLYVTCFYVRFCLTVETCIFLSEWTHRFSHDVLCLTLSVAACCLQFIHPSISFDPVQFPCSEKHLCIFYSVWITFYFLLRALFLPPDISCFQILVVKFKHHSTAIEKKKSHQQHLHYPTMQCFAFAPDTPDPSCKFCQRWRKVMNHTCLKTLVHV